MLRLDPAHPPLWRDPACVQFGADDVARLEDPQPWEQRLLRELTLGMTEATLAAVLRSEGIADERAEAFLAELQPVLQIDPPAPRIRLQSGDDVAERDASHISDAMRRAGAIVTVQRWAGAATGAVEKGETAVLLAGYRLDPRRAVALVSEDVRHLPLVFDAAGAVIGPIVEPGVTACLACGDAFARDADPAWPVVAAQLLGRTIVPHPDLAVEAARAAVHLAAAPVASPSRSVRISGDSAHRRWRAHPPHAECGCRSLAESVTALVPFAPRREPSSTRASAQRG